MDGKDASELVSMPVVATGEGREIGRIRDVIFDPERQSMLGLLVVDGTAGAGADLPMFIERADILGVGNDAVTVGAATVLKPYATHAEAQRIAESGIHLRGATVLTEGGNSLGKVDKVLIDEDGAIAGYMTSSGMLGFGEHREVRANQVRRIGTDALIVADADAGQQPPVDMGYDGSSSGTPPPPAVV